MAIGRIRIEIGGFAAVQQIHSSIAFCLIAKASLSLHEAAYLLWLLHVDIQYITCADGSLRHAGIVTNLDIGDVFGLHLTEYESVVAIHRDIVETKVVVRYHFFIAFNHQVRHYLEDIHQCLFSRQFHALRIDDRPVCLDLYNGQAVVCENRGR